jgi:hypothetical protein
MDIADLKGPDFLLSLRSAESFNDWAIRRGSSKENTPGSKSRALLLSVTFWDHFFLSRSSIRKKAPCLLDPYDKLRGRKTIPTIHGKLQLNLLLVAFVGQMPDMTWDEMSVGSCHGAFFLECSSCPPNEPAKTILEPFFHAISSYVNRLTRPLMGDPAPGPTRLHCLRRTLKPSASTITISKLYQQT